jgi:hypothetical protein
MRQAANILFSGPGRHSERVLLVFVTVCAVAAMMNLLSLSDARRELF